MPDLDDEIMQAHACDDRHRLCSLYLMAGEIKEAAGETDAACFFYTQSFVYGLETGNEDRDAAHARLVALGREQL